jgi:hypothetical protein
MRIIPTKIITIATKNRELPTGKPGLAAIEFSDLGSQSRHRHCQVLKHFSQATRPQLRQTYDASPLLHTAHMVANYFTK